MARDILDDVLSRWGSLVLGALLTGRKRYSELRIEVDGISQKMLAQTLRELERDGLISRESFPVVPPHVEYELTVLGRALALRVYGVVLWIENNLGAFKAAQEAFSARRASEPRGVGR